MLQILRQRLLLLTACRQRNVQRMKVPLIRLCVMVHSGRTHIRVCGKRQNARLGRRLAQCRVVHEACGCGGPLRLLAIHFLHGKAESFTSGHAQKSHFFFSKSCPQVILMP
jgi:hypothetical protein